MEIIKIFYGGNLEDGEFEESMSEGLKELPNLKYCILVVNDVKSLYYDYIFRKCFK